MTISAAVVYRWSPYVDRYQYIFKAIRSNTPQLTFFIPQSAVKSSLSRYFDRMSRETVTGTN